jgi:phosphate starvation-inducible protein PhoH and related proteins
VNFKTHSGFMYMPARQYPQKSKRQKSSSGTPTIESNQRFERRTPKPESLQLKKIRPLTENQAIFFDEWEDCHSVAAVGSPGTGKTFLGMYLALQAVKAGNQKKVIVVRSAVATRDQGFLPGSLAEKEEVYKLPYRQIVNELYESGTAWDSLTKSPIPTIEFMTTSFIRGITIDDAVIIFDEIQNATNHEIFSTLTRLGKNSRVIVIGDTKQCDLTKKHGETGIYDLMKVIQAMQDDFGFVEFTRDDIVRSGFVKKLIIAMEDVL